jgi:hypothetical protein
MSAKRTPNPEGWNLPWPFADEIELWRIPDEQKACAFRYEIMRELRMNDKDGRPASPWLSNNLAFYRAALSKYGAGLCLRDDLESISEENHIDWQSLGYEADDGESMFSEPALWMRENMYLIPGKQSKAPLSSDTCNDVLALIKISGEATRKEMIEGFEAILDQLNVPRGGARGKSAEDYEANLGWLALMRARHYKPASTFTEGIIPEIRFKVQKDTPEDYDHLQKELLRTKLKPLIKNKLGVEKCPPLWRE